MVAQRRRELCANALRSVSYEFLLCIIACYGQPNSPPVSIVRIAEFLPRGVRIFRIFQNPVLSRDVSASLLFLRRRRLECGTPLDECAFVYSANNGMSLGHRLFADF
jgi:hypothetical protein